MSSKKSSNVSSRYIACEILCSILEFGENSQEVLNWQLQNAAATAQERAQITAMVYGTIDYLTYLDFCLEANLKKPLLRLEPMVRTILRLGVWQILKSYAIPKPVAVSESVKLCHDFQLNYAKGLVNAVLRNVNEPELNRRQEHLRYGMNSELFGLLRKWYSADAIEIATSYLRHRQYLTVKLSPKALAKKAGLLQSWREQGVEVEEDTYFPDSLRLKLNGTVLSNLEGYADGWFYIQDEAAMLPAAIMEAYYSESNNHLRILDLCAGVGGKSIDLAWNLPYADIYANEPNQHRRQLLLDNIAKYNVDLQVSDILFTATTEFIADNFDAVLIDAPCSGLGVVGHKPEIKHRLTYDQVQTFPKLQLDLIEAAKKLLVDGGILLYATCTINPSENQLIADRLLADTDFEPVSLTGLLPDKLNNELVKYSDEGLNLDLGRVFLRPDRLPVDGFFVQVARKNEQAK